MSSGMRRSQEDLDKMLQQGNVKEHKEPQGVRAHRFVPTPVTVDDELARLGVPEHVLGRPLVVLDLPLPPSNNKYWYPARKGKQILTPEAKRYRVQVKKHLYLLPAEVRALFPLRCRLVLRSVVHFKTLQKADTANRSKALDDALEHAGVFLDDEQIDLQVMQRGEIVRGGRIVVRIEEFGGDVPKYIAQESRHE